MKHGGFRLLTNYRKLLDLRGITFTEFVLLRICPRDWFSNILLLQNASGGKNFRET
jgi:hypothetical protein